MNMPSITPGAATGAGELTTFYAYDSGAARSLVLSNMAWLLAGPRHGSAPVLMIDWDLESPGLHHLFGGAGERPGLLELFTAWRDQLAAMPDSVDAEARAQQVLATIDWRDHVERVDTSRPLYLLRAGRIDASYGERAARLDWDALFHACPPLLRQWRVALAAAYRHVFIDARCGRSAAVSVCTSLLPDKIVGLFTPARRSLDGLCGVVERAIAYRVTHEEAQRPLLLYPLPCVSTRSDGAWRQAWRRGGRTGSPHVPGYQPVLEALMEASYGRTHLSLESYFDKIQLPPLDAGDVPASGADPDRLATGRTLLALLDWFTDGYFPWQSHAELMLLRTIVATLAVDQSHDVQHLLGRFSHAYAGAGHLAGSDAPVQFPALRSLAHAVLSVPALRVSDAVSHQLDHLQQLVDRQALCEARPVADRLRDLVLCPAVAHALRRRGAALIKLVYRHDNDTDALLAFTQDELASLEQVLNEAAAGRPLAMT
jgi:hypothetical protein